MSWKPAGRPCAACRGLGLEYFEASTHAAVGGQWSRLEAGERRLGSQPAWTGEERARGQAVPARAMDAAASATYSSISGGSDMRGVGANNLACVGRADWREAMKSCGRLRKCRCEWAQHRWVERRQRRQGSAKSQVADFATAEVAYLSVCVYMSISFCFTLKILTARRLFQDSC